MAAAALESNSIGSAAWSFQECRACCPACGDARIEPLFTSTDLLYRTTDQRFQVSRCQSCGLVRLTPPVTAQQLSAFYPAKYWFASGVLSSFEDAYRKFVLQDHIRFVMEAYGHTAKQGFILDVGCGGGLLLSLLRMRGVPVLGMDFSTEAASIAWGANFVPVVCATVDHAPLAPATCAVITMFHVIEHLIDPVAHLRAARRLLAPGGRLIVQVPNADCWQFSIFGRRWNGIDVPRHMIDYRAADIIRLLETCGFRIERTKHFSLRDNPAGFATSFATPLDPMVRRLSGALESTPMRLVKSLLYLALVVAAVPFTLLEAACKRGSTVMIEASVANG